MTSRPTETETLEDTLAEGIAVLMAADDQLSQPGDLPEDLADLFLEELNRLWADPEPLTLN
jgi:hypothetical protein